MTFIPLICIICNLKYCQKLNTESKMQVIMLILNWLMQMLFRSYVPIKKSLLLKFTGKNTVKQNHYQF